jgi:hypothetical protein
VNRGRGDAELTFGDETALSDEDFESESLGGQPFPDASNSELLGVELVAPEVDAHGESAGAVDVGASAGFATWKRRLSPSQRAAVRRFFTPPEK